jgi:hypothetical protein
LVVAKQQYTNVPYCTKDGATTDSIDLESDAIQCLPATVRGKGAPSYAGGSPQTHTQVHSSWMIRGQRSDAAVGSPRASPWQRMGPCVRYARRTSSLRDGAWSAPMDHPRRNKSSLFSPPSGARPFVVVPAALLKERGFGPEYVRQRDFQRSDVRTLCTEGSAMENVLGSKLSVW